MVKQNINGQELPEFTDLIESLRTRIIYNRMSFEDFIKKYEEYTGKKVCENEISQWKFTGLNNTDYLISMIEDTF